jgi:hypothetical protein
MKLPKDKTYKDQHNKILTKYHHLNIITDI